MSQTDLFSLEPVQGPDGIPPDVVALYEALAFEILQLGFNRYSSDAILHRIRWHKHIERGQREFKCNDHWTAVLARWFMDKHPECEGFFETRERRR
jgi:hypothetical protein